MEGLREQPYWTAKLWMDKETIKVLQQRGLRCPAIPGMEHDDVYLCYVHFVIEEGVRETMKPTGYIVRFGDTLHYFASLRAEKEHFFRKEGQRVIRSRQIQQKISSGGSGDLHIIEWFDVNEHIHPMTRIRRMASMKSEALFWPTPPEDFASKIDQDADEILAQQEARKQMEEHLQGLARRYPEFFNTRVKPFLEEKGIEAPKYVAEEPDQARRQWAAEYAGIKAEPEAYEILVSEGNAWLAAALLAQIFEHINPVRYIDAYQYSCTDPYDGLTMTQAIEKGNDAIKGLV